MQHNGLPFGVTLVGRTGTESALLRLGDRYHRSTGLPLGATGCAFAEEAGQAQPRGRRRLPGSGLRWSAHLSGMPLNHQLTDRGARLVRTCRTSPDYRLFALPGTKPPKPGLIRTVAEPERFQAIPSSGRQGIEIEIWEMSVESFGSFVAAIPPPLGIGTITLEDGSSVKSFLCEQYALAGAQDITAFGGWRAFPPGRMPDSKRDSVTPDRYS